MDESTGKDIRSEQILYFIIWTIVTILPMTLEYWKYINTSDFEWEHIFKWWFRMIPLLIIFVINNHILIPRFLNKGRIVHYATSILVVIIVFGSVFYSIDINRMKRNAPPTMDHNIPLHRLPPEKPEFSHFPPDKRPPGILPIQVLFQLALGLLTIGSNVAISLTFSYRREKTNRKDLENLRLQEELKYLKQQISPHFFMNVLNNIHEMAEEDVKKAQEMILELSHLMRYVLYESEHHTTTLSAETRFITSYVNLMKMRYLEDKVNISIELPDDTSRDINIPPLLFIPFIGNAFKHGVSYLTNTVIDICLHERDGKVIFKCVNTIPHKQNNIKNKGGVGLSNVRRRLDLLFGKEYSLHIKNDGVHYSVTLIIPSI